MKTTTVSISGLLERINRNEIRLPEIQRSYVWKPAQVAGLIDSLYRRYPSGSLLLWETDSPVGERTSSIDGPNETPITRPQYLLDGQQRLTSLFRVWSGDERARVVFNVEHERFQIESAATRRDRRWVPVHDLLRDKVSTFALSQEISERGSVMGPDAVFKRLEQVRKILDYPYFIEILENLPYLEVTSIFVRVNSKGRPLRKVDLALATLSARWPGVVKKLEDEAAYWQARGYRHLEISFLTRCLAALATDTATFDGFAAVSQEALDAGWSRTRRGIAHLVPLLKNNAGIATSQLLPSVNALVPLVAFLGTRSDDALEPHEANSLLYWLYGAFLLGRFNQSADTVIAQDVAAVRSPDPLRGLFKNLGLLGSRLVVTEEALAGRGANSPYFLFSYLVARSAGATDWYHGVKVGIEAEGTFKLEYHHVHPRARLRGTYTKAEINDLANLVFISAKANRKISHRRPVEYFAELSEAELSSHFIPLDPALRTTDAYPRFVQERRRLLAEAMTTFLEEHRPVDLTDSQPLGDPTAGETLDLVVYSSYPESSNGVAHFSVRSGATSWEAQVPLTDLLMFIEDVESGLAARILVGADISSVDAGAENIEVLVGPLRVTGTLSDWRALLDRELLEVSPVSQAPEMDSGQPWTAERRLFPVADIE